MSINDIIAQMKIDVSSLSLGETAIGGIAVTVLSMLIVFIVLTLLMYLIKIMTKIMDSMEPKKTKSSVEPQVINNTSVRTDDFEEIAAIMAAISSINSVGENKLVIKNISYVGESNWALQGRISQVVSRR